MNRGTSSAQERLSSEGGTVQRASEELRVTVGARARFAWFIIWALAVTIPVSFIQVITHQFRPTARNFKRWLRAWGGLILAGSGVGVTLQEDTALNAEQAYVFVANHQNLLDILALGKAIPYPFGFVAKAELARVPFLGFAVGNSASIFIDRSDSRRSLVSLQKAVQQIRRGNSVLLFAEGSRTFAPVVHPFKKGAFILAVEAGVPLVPVTVVDGYRLMDERRYAMRSGTIHIRMGTPVATAGHRRRDVPALMEAVRSQIDAALEAERDAAIGEGQPALCASPHVDKRNRPSQAP